MVLSNEKKRREFVENPQNWEVLPSADNFVRVSKLLYKGHMWFHIEIWQTYEHFDPKARMVIPTTQWVDRGYYKISKRTHALTYQMSIDDIADEIKEIDKKEKEK
jgi:hypothetical protein